MELLPESVFETALTVSFFVLQHRSRAKSSQANSLFPCNADGNMIQWNVLG